MSAKGTEGRKRPGRWVIGHGQSGAGDWSASGELLKLITIARKTGSSIKASYADVRPRWRFQSLHSIAPGSQTRHEFSETASAAIPTTRYQSRAGDFGFCRSTFRNVRLKRDDPAGLQKVSAACERFVFVSNSSLFSCVDCFKTARTSDTRCGCRSPSL